MIAATKANDMNKPKRNKQPRQFGLADDAVVSQIESPQPKRYVPPEHQGCMALRKNAFERYGEVRSTQTVNTTDETIVTRYCHCRFCGVSYQDVTIIRR